MPLQHIAYGSTVADLRRLLRRADRIFLHLASGMRGNIFIVSISRGHLARSLTTDEAETVMPCQLQRHGDGLLSLSVGSLVAIHHAESLAAQPQAAE
jgi:hypothetical protein